MTNTSGYTLWMRPEVRFRRPDGTTLGIVGFDNQVASGSYSEQDFFITADQVGTYQHNLAVYVGMWQDAMSLTISWPWTNAAIVAAVAMGTITAVQYRHPTTGAWGTTAPAYVVGHTLEVRALGCNESGVPMTAWIDLDITDPDGTKTTLTHDPVEQPAGETWTWPFTRELNKVGTWSLAFKYYGEV